MVAGLVTWVSPLTALAQPYDSETVTFEQGSFDQPGDREIWQIPQTSGSTLGIFVNSTGVENHNTSRRSQSPWGGANGSATGYRVIWEWKDGTDPESWVRLTTFNTVERPNPALDTTGKIQFQISNNSFDDFTSVNFCVGIRETGANVPMLANGGTSGAIEWVGVDETDSIIECGTNGCDAGTMILDDDFLVETNGLSWIDRGPDAQLDSTAAGDDEVKYGYFRIANSNKIPIPAYQLDILFDYATVTVDLATGDITSVDSLNGTVVHPGGIVNFANGNDVLDPPNDRGTLEHFGFTKVPTSGATRVDLVIDNIKFIANNPDPAQAPSVVAPIVQGDQFVTVTDLQFGVDRVYLYRDGNTVGFEDVSDTSDVQFDLGVGNEAVQGEIFTARQRIGDSGEVSPPSIGVMVVASPPPFNFSLLIDESGSGSCSFAAPGWEWVGVSSVYTVSPYWSPEGTTPLVSLDGVWQTIDISLQDNETTIASLGGNGSLIESPVGYYTIDSIWFDYADTGTNGPWEVLVDGVQLVTNGGADTETIMNMEDGVRRFGFVRGQSPDQLSVTQLFNDGSYDGGTSHRFVWTYGPNEPKSVGPLQRTVGCGTSEPIWDDTESIRFHMVIRGQPTNPDVPLPLIAGPVAGLQDSVRVVTDPDAISVELYINGIGQGAVATAGTDNDFTGLSLLLGDSISAKQTFAVGIGSNGVSDLAYPRALAAPPPPSVAGLLVPGDTSVSVEDIYTALYAEADDVAVYVNGMFSTNGAPSGDTLALSIDPLTLGDEVQVTQTVNGVESELSDPVIVGVPVPTVAPELLPLDVVVPVSDVHPSATMVTAYVNSVGFSVNTTGVTAVNVPVPALSNGDVVTATQTIGGIESDFADEVIVAVPAPTVPPPLLPLETVVPVLDIKPSATLVTAYVNSVGYSINTTGITALDINVPALAEGDQVWATQTIDGIESPKSGIILVETPQTPCGIAFSDDFDTDTSANWIVNGTADVSAQFAWDYSQLFIPPSPNGGGTTKGLRLAVNISSGTTDAITLAPVGQAFGGDYRMRFDMWMNVNGPLPGGGTGSTEYVTAGVGYNGTTINRAGVSGSGGWFAVDGEGGSTRDYRAYKNGSEQFAESGQFFAGTSSASGGAHNNTHPYYDVFPPMSPPDAQSNAFPQQTGSTNPGCVGFAWREVVITRQGTTVTWEIDGLPIVHLEQTIGSTFPVTGNISIGYLDPFTSISDNPQLSFGVIDNLVVEGWIGGDCNGNGTADGCEVIDAGDWNVDGAVDIDDAAAFVDCLAGPDVTPTPTEETCVDACLDAFDFDADGDLDLRDFWSFQAAFDTP